MQSQKQLVLYAGLLSVSCMRGLPALHMSNEPGKGAGLSACANPDFVNKFKTEDPNWTAELNLLPETRSNCSHKMAVIYQQATGEASEDKSAVLDARCPNMVVELVV